MGEKPDVSHFCIFDSLVNFYVLDKKRKKLNPIIENGIFVDYNDTSKEYRVYIPTQRNIFIRREVKFEEHRALKKSLKV